MKISYQEDNPFCRSFFFSLYEIKKPRNSSRKHLNEDKRSEIQAGIDKIQTKTLFPKDLIDLIALYASDKNKLDQSLKPFVDSCLNLDGRALSQLSLALRKGESLDPLLRSARKVVEIAGRAFFYLIVESVYFVIVVVAHLLAALPSFDGDANPLDFLQYLALLSISPLILTYRIIVATVWVFEAIKMDVVRYNQAYKAIKNQLTHKEHTKSWESLERYFSHISHRYPLKDLTKYIEFAKRRNWTTKQEELSALLEATYVACSLEMAEKKQNGFHLNDGHPNALTPDHINERFPGQYASSP